MLYIKKLLLNKIDTKLKKFLIVGTINNIVFYSIYSIFLFFGLRYDIAVLIATILAIFFNFNTMSKFVFNSNQNIAKSVATTSNEVKEFKSFRYSSIFRFIASYILIYLLNISTLYIFNSFNFNMYIAGFITTVSLAFISFILNKNFVFNR